MDLKKISARRLTGFLMMNKPILTVRSLTAGYGSIPVIHDISLTVEPGEIVALVGPNGSGKTTLIRAITGIIPSFSGSVWVDGKELSALSIKQRAQLLATVPQARRLPEGYTVWQTVLYGRTPYLGWMGKPTDRDLQICQWALESTQLVDLMDKTVEDLSGGEQQLVLVARALAQETPVLLLDEPTAHLDLRHQAVVLKLVQQLAHDHRLAVLMSLHDLNLVSLFADRVALLGQGRMHALGTPGEVLDEKVLTKVFRVPLHILPHPVLGVPLVFLDGKGEALTQVELLR